MELKGNKKLIIDSSKALSYCMVMIAVIQASALYSNATSLSTAQFRMYIRVFVVTLLIFTCVGIIVVNRCINLSWALLIPILYYLLTFVNYYTGELPIFTVLTILVFMLMSDEQKKHIYICFKWVMVIAAAAGIMCFIAYMLHISALYKTVPYYTQQGRSVYISFKIIYLYVNTGATRVRLCGFMNEPGMFGTFLALLLCADKVNLRKKANFIMFVAGCLTFSMAFFLLIFFYLIYLGRKRPAIALFLLTVWLFIFFIAPNIDWGNGNIANLMMRFSFSNGKLNGNNRTNMEYDLIFNKWLKSGKLLWGYGRGYSAAMTDRSLSYKSYLMDYGIIGFCIAYVPLMFYAIKKAIRNTDMLFFVFCFFISVYQRPNIYSLAYFVVLLGGLEVQTNKTD